MICPKCGEEFDYVPATSRIDGSEICEPCSVKEALDAVGIVDQDEILDVVRKGRESAIK